MSTAPHPIDQEEIMAHLDGELSSERAKAVSLHLEACAICQELVTSLPNTSESLSTWTVGSVPASLEKSVMLAAEKAPFGPPFGGSGLSPGTPLWTRKQWIGGLSATAAVAVLLFSLSVPTRYRSQPALEKTKAFMELREERAQGAKNEPVDAARINAGRERQAGNGYKGWLAGKDKSPLPVTTSRLTLPLPMIARIVSLSIIAKDFDSSRASLDSILARHNGYAAELDAATPEGAARSLQASLRIPAPQLPAALAELKALGRVELETQNGEEVTEQHADLVARLKNSRETEQRLQAILTERTGKVGDVLSVEQEIARVRGEIEQMEAEQKNLEHRVDFSTIDLKLSEEYKAKLDSLTPSISTQIHNAAVRGYLNVADTLLSLVLFFAEYGPVLCFWLLLLSLPAGLVWRRWRHAAAAI